METAATLSRRAQRLYQDAPGFSAKLQTLRPYICPFESIIPLMPQDAQVLDAGCGAGLFLGLLADCRRISRGTGFDSSHAAVSLAQQMQRRLAANVSIEIRHLDATAEWPDESYDVVSLIDVLHHVTPQSQPAVLSKAIERVRKGGMLLYKDMALRPRWRALCNQAHDLLLAKQWIHHVPIGAVDRLASVRGMTELARGSASRYWYAHEWRVFGR